MKYKIYLPKIALFISKVEKLFLFFNPKYVYVFVQNNIPNIPRLSSLFCVSYSLNSLPIIYKLLQ